MGKIHGNPDQIREQYAKGLITKEEMEREIAFAELENLEEARNG